MTVTDQAIEAETIAWMRAALIEQAAALVPYGVGNRATRSKAEKLWPRTAQILQRVAPEKVHEIRFGYGYWYLAAQQAINFALGVLDHQEEIAQHLGAKGPVLTAAGLHPWVWQSAAPLWSASHQDAVNAAARAVNTHLRSKVGSPLNEVKLTNEAFSHEDPKAGRKRLRFPGPRDESWTSRMNGARGLGQACFQGVRNIGTHEDPDWSEQEALEYLAMFSVLARWIEECGVEPLSDYQ